MSAAFRWPTAPHGFWIVSIFAAAVAAAVLYVLRRIGGRGGHVIRPALRALANIDQE